MNDKQSTRNTALKIKTGISRSPPPNNYIVHKRSKIPDKQKGKKWKQNERKLRLHKTKWYDGYIRLSCRTIIIYKQGSTYDLQSLFLSSGLLDLYGLAT